MNLLIVDDEALARAELVRLCTELVPGFSCTEAATLPQARSALLKESFDAAFIDIELAGADGMDLLQDAEAAGSAAIIVTAHDHRALAAYDGGALDYLMKPVEPGRLFRALSKVAKFRQQSIRDWLLLSDQTNCWPVQPSQILMVEAEGSYTVVHFAGRPALTVCRPAKDIEAQLDRGTFIRANRGQLVNLKHVEVLHRLPSGKMVARLAGVGEIVFSRRQARAFRGRFGE
jgi:two-component system LytT family response regulator